MDQKRVDGQGAKAASGQQAAGDAGRLGSMKGFALRALLSILRAAWLLARITLPISLLVAFFQWLGLVNYLSLWLDPLMGYLGLPGKASLALISGFFLDLYSTVAIIEGLKLAPRALVIISVSCLMAHNLPVELAIMRKTGSSALRMLALRLGAMVLSAFLLNALLPGAPAPLAAKAALPGPEAGEMEPYQDLEVQEELPTLTFVFKPEPPLGALKAWAFSAGPLLLKMLGLTVLVMFFKNLFDELGLMKKLARVFTPFLAILGLPPGFSLVWFVSQLIGYSYGAAMLSERIRQGEIDRKDADLANYHLALNHSLLEETLLFFSLGLPWFWAVLPRLGLAFLAAWGEKFRRWVFRRSMRVGTY